jgi:hypothetical protein
VCAVCDAGYAYQSITQKCEACSDASSTLGTFTVIVVVFIVIIAADVAYFIHSNKIKNMTELYSVIFTKLGVLDPMATDQAKQARIVAIRFKSALKINVTMWQIVSIMPFALNLKFPDAYTAVVAALDAFNIGVSRSSLVSCTSGYSYDAIDSLVVDTTYPVIVAVIIWLAHLLHLNLTQIRSTALDAMVKANYHKVFLVFTYLLLPSTCAKIFQMFSCQDVDPDNDVSGDDEYMTVDYSVSCSSSKYHFGFAWAIASILVYPIGVPAYYFYVLYTSREMIQNRDDLTSLLPSTTSDEQSADNVTTYLQSILLLFEAYEPKYWYWEVIETMRRLMLTGVLVLIAQGSAVQIIVGICLSLFFLVLYDTYSPFADPIVGRVEAVSQRQILCVFFLALLVKADFGSVSIVALDVFLILAIFANLLYIVFKFLLWRCTTVSTKEQSAKIQFESEHESEMVSSPFRAASVDCPKAVKGAAENATSTEQRADRGDDNKDDEDDEEKAGGGAVEPSSREKTGEGEEEGEEGEGDVSGTG